jgi:hypothetical protein
MKCWSCDKEIPAAAKRCSHCEAAVQEEPTEEEKAEVMAALDQMDPDVLGEFARVLEGASSGEDFVNQIMVGPCPQCGSASTGDCENDPEIEDPCIGRCTDCGQLWCCDCEDLFKTSAEASSHDCPVWAELEKKLDELEDDL